MIWPRWIQRLMGARRGSYDDRLGGDERDHWATVTAETEVNWREALSDFNERVWPIFREHGYTKDGALQVWMISRIENTVDHIAVHVCEASEGHDSSSEEPVA